MSNFTEDKEVARQLILDLKCSVCKDVPSLVGFRRNRYVCSKGDLVCEGCKPGACSCGSKSFNGPVKFVENILDVHKKYRQLIQEVFVGDQQFIGALDKACTAVINHREPKQQAKAPELVST